MRALLLLALLALAAPAAAQEVPIVQAGAGGRFERQIDAKTRVEGFGQAQVAALRNAISPIIEQLAAMPSVNSPPDPVRHRLKSWVELVNTHGVIGAEIDVMTPINFQHGRCSRMTGGGILIGVNLPSMGLDPSHSTFRRSDSDDRGDWYVLAFQPPRNPRLITYDMNGDDYVIITHGRAPLYRPVSMEAYLGRRLAEARKFDAESAASRARDTYTEADFQQWLREEKPRIAAMYEQQAKDIAPYAKPGQVAKMRVDAVKLLADQEAAMRQKVINSAAAGPSSAAAPWERTLAALSPGQRAQPACYGAGPEPTPNPACPPDRTLIELNPNYFDRSRPTDIQLLVLSTPSHRYHGENDTMLASRTAMWADLDRAALAALVR